MLVNTLHFMFSLKLLPWWPAPPHLASAFQMSFIFRLWYCMPPGAPRLPQSIYWKWFILPTVKISFETTLVVDTCDVIHMTSYIVQPTQYLFGFKRKDFGICTPHIDRIRCFRPFDLMLWFLLWVQEVQGLNKGVDQVLGGIRFIRHCSMDGSDLAHHLECLLNYSHSRNPPCAPARTHGRTQAPREPPN
jgi:hypothetical protein